MQKTKNILLISRAPHYSPNSVERDRAILTAVGENLQMSGHHLEMVAEDELPVTTTASVIFSMGRRPETLRWLAAQEGKGTRVINSGRSLSHINRKQLLQTACQLGIDVPPFAIGPCDTCPLPYPFWWKRDDRTSQEASDVVLVKNEEEWLELALKCIMDYVVEQHIEGDIVKFYSVEGTPFFHWNYPQFSKFGNETANGATTGYAFDADLLKKDADRLAHAVGLSIYGGDAIVTAQGQVYIIDFNDWPSFSSCRKEAAQAIVSLIEH